MFKIISRILCIVIMALSLPSLASEALDNDDKDLDYYTDEGRLLFKIRGFGAITAGKLKSMPAPTNAVALRGKNLVRNGFGIDTATVVFFNDNIASELSLGFGVLRAKDSTISNISASYGAGNYKSKRKDIYMIPLTLTAQYHIAPFGAIRPYVGAGYHGAYLFTKSKAFKINNGHGPVLQVGVDFVAKDDTLITFDIRQYYLKTKVIFKDGLVGNNRGFSSKTELNPLVFSVGLGFKL